MKHRGIALGALLGLALVPTGAAAASSVQRSAGVIVELGGVSREHAILLKQPRLEEMEDAIDLPESHVVQAARAVAPGLGPGAYQVHVEREEATLLAKPTISQGSRVELTPKQVNPTTSVPTRARGGPVSAGETKVGIALGAAIPAYGIGFVQHASPAVSGWLARPVRGPWIWRAEVGRVRMELPGRAALRCAAAGFVCDGNLTVSSFTGGLQLEPGSSKAIAPYGHVGVGLFHISADAVVEDVREYTEQLSSSWNDNAFGVVASAGARAKLGERWTLRAELRYTGFNYKPGTVHWAAILAPTLSLAGGF